MKIAKIEEPILTKRKGLKTSLCINLILGALLITWSIFTPKTIIVVEASKDRGGLLEKQDSSAFIWHDRDISQYQKMTDQELLALSLQAPVPLFSGFTSTDIALSLLYERGFTIDLPLKEIQRWPQNMVSIPVKKGGSEKEAFICFSSLTREDIQKIQRYLQEEKAPFSSQKVFELLKQDRKSFLKDAFYRTQEFSDLKKLLSPPFTSDEALLEYLCMFSWKAIQEHIELLQVRFQDNNQKYIKGKLVQIAVTDFMRTPSPKLARCLLIHFPRTFLLKISSSVFFREFFRAIPDDLQKEGIQFALQLIQAPVQETISHSAQRYIAIKMGSPELETISRKDFILAAQKKTLAKKTTQEEIPPPGKSELVKKVEVEVKAIPTKKLKPSEEVACVSDVLSQSAKNKISPFIIYTVRKGDTLWSISKKFHVSVDKIRYLNRIKGKTLAPGTVLKIPKAS